MKDMTIGGDEGLAMAVFIGSLVLLIGMAMWAVLYGTRGDEEDENNDDDRGG